MHQLGKLNFWVGGRKDTSSHKAPHKYHSKAEASAEAKVVGSVNSVKCNLTSRACRILLGHPTTAGCLDRAVLWSCWAAQVSMQVTKEHGTWSWSPSKSATSSTSLLHHSSSTKQTVHLAANRVSNKGWQGSSNPSQSQGKKDAWNSRELAYHGMLGKKCKGMKMYSTMLSVLRSSGDRAISRCIRLEIYQG